MNKEIIDDVVKRYFETGNMSEALAYLKQIVKEKRK